MLSPLQVLPFYAVPFCICFYVAFFELVEKNGRALLTLLNCLSTVVYVTYIVYLIHCEDAEENSPKMKKKDSGRRHRIQRIYPKTRKGKVVQW